MSAARTASSPAVRRAFAQATAAVAKTAPETRAAKLVADVVQLYSEPGKPALPMSPGQLFIPVLIACCIKSHSSLCLSTNTCG